MTTNIANAQQDYLEANNQPPGWSAPVFFGLVPEIGLYLQNRLPGKRRAT